MAEGDGERTPDLLLHVFVGLANTQVETSYMSMTLHTLGGVFAGELTGNRRWLELFREYLFRHSEPAASIAAGLKAYDDILAGLEGGNNDGAVPIGFIHLEAAYRLDAGVWTPLEPMMLWRGRIEDVSSWVLGTPGPRRD